MQKFIYGSLLLAGFHSFPLPAAEPIPDEPADLPEMVVTATRSEIDKKQLATATTVYTRQDIERLQSKTLPELLKGTVGLDLTQQGGDGKITSVFMRGTDSSHILVLVDGIKVGSATIGATAFEFIPIDQIERVEIIRGPQSSLYGSEAIGGVIQIFTRKGSRSEQPAVTLDAGGGTYDTIRTAGTVSGKWQNSWYTVGASHYNTQGFDAREPVPGFFGVDQPEHDGYYNTAVNARLGHRFDNEAEIEGSFIRAQGKTEYDGTFQDKTKFINQVASLSGSMDLLYVFTFHGLRGVSPERILQYIASGLQGAAAFQGGHASAALGAAAHYFILVVAAALFLFASRRLIWLRERAAAAGVLYGAAIYVVMRFIVVPLSAASPGQGSGLAQATNLLMHLFVIGPAISLGLRHWARSPG